MKRPSLIALFVTLISATNLSGAATSAEIEYQLVQCESKGGNCIQKLETSILSEPASKAKHKGDTLVIQTQTGVVSFKDRPNAGDQLMLNTYLGILDGLGYHLVYRQRWEGGEFVLVSDTSGEQFHMAAIPHASPARRWLVSVSASEAYDANEITIWRVTPQRLTQEFHYSPDEYALYKFLDWKGEDTVLVEKFIHSNTKLCPKSQFMTVGETLKHTQGRWLLVEEKPTKNKCQ